ncbi:hypothetical protein [Salipiger aestuarii]|uniref:hypothetical protein n=1 Tax=Salipiger aestuarii TaxID=568098 RepID=UPI0002FDD170|nr:hypothetical protein [Salipiger aestuarii]
MSDDFRPVAGDTAGVKRNIALSRVARLNETVRRTLGDLAGNGLASPSGSTGSRVPKRVLATAVGSSRGRPEILGYGGVLP